MFLDLYEYEGGIGTLVLSVDSVFTYKKWAETKDYYVPQDRWNG